MATLSKAQQDMMEALTWLVSEPDTFRPGINLHGSGQYATARALAKRGLVQFLPIGRVEPSRALYALASVRSAK